MTEPLAAAEPARSGVFSGARIHVIGAYAYPDSFEWHVTDSLRHLGCSVDLFHSREGLNGWTGRALEKLTNTMLREPERLIETRLLRSISDFSPTLILVLLGNHISPKTIAAIRGISHVPIVCWCQDQMTTLGRQFLLGAGYDAVFVKDRYMLDLFSRMIRSTSFHYLPEACNPRMHRPIDLTQPQRDEYGCDVMLAGTLYYYRQEILNQLGDFDLKVWGTRPDWLMQKMRGRFMGRYVHGDEKVFATLAAKVCLNTLHYAEVDALNCRAFEIAGCGGFQLVTDVPVVREHFEPDVELSTFRSADELLDKLRFFLDNPQLALEIADRGRARAHREHTYEQRLT
ncbi:MAG: glycosyltransferase [Steroidobacteraceae bacterium]